MPLVYSIRFSKNNIGLTRYRVASVKCLKTEYDVSFLTDVIQINLFKKAKSNNVNKFVFGQTFNIWLFITVYFLK